MGKNAGINLMDSVQLLALQAWYTTSNEGLLVIDTSGNICLINPRLRELLGLRETATRVDELLVQTRKTVPELPSLLESNNIGDQTRWGNVRVQGVPPRRVSWKQTPLFDQGQRVGSLFIFGDAASEGQLELTKQSFLSMISHDLRTPLSTIVGFADLLKSHQGNPLDAEQREFLEHIIKNANELSRYTQIALDIMFLEATSHDFEVEPVTLEDFVKHWLSDAIHRFPAQRLVYQNGGRKGPVAQIAPSALHKILHILVEFALQESPADQNISIQLAYGTSQAHIRIDHKAPRLSPEDAVALFQLMHPRDLSESGRPHLHRMQLYVAGLLAERQHGLLTLNKKENDDYQFDIALPLASGNINS